MVDAGDAAGTPEAAEGPVRRVVPRRRTSSTRSFTVGAAKGYMTVSAFDDGTLAEVELRMAKQGSTLAGMMDALSGAWSTGLQHGAPLEVYVRKLSNTRSEPSGLTNDPELPTATSAMDYVARRLAVDFLDREERQALGVLTAQERAQSDDDGGDTGLVGLSMSGS